MENSDAHIIILDGKKGSGRKTLCFELALTLIYNNNKTAVLLAPTSPLKKILEERSKTSPSLPSPDVIEISSFNEALKKYNAIIIPEGTTSDELSINASTYITLLSKDKSTTKHFQQDSTYLNNLWELKKKIASTKNHSLNWVVCENNKKDKISTNPSEELLKMSKLYGFRVSPPLNYRKSYQSQNNGISAQDKLHQSLQKELTYDDICAKREIIKLAEFIFNP